MAMKWESKYLRFMMGLGFGFRDIVVPLMISDDYLFGNVCGCGSLTFPMDL
jgi:hypothetical protein